MSNTSDFCPECDNILYPYEPEDDYDSEDSELKDEEKGLFLRCAVCAYKRPTNTYRVTHFTKSFTDNTKLTTKQGLFMDPYRIRDMIYDNTYLRTMQISCANKECPSRGKKNPEIMLITSSKHTELGYICSVCKFTWGKFE